MSARDRIKERLKPALRKGSEPLVRAIAPQVAQYGSYWPHEHGTGSYSRPTSASLVRSPADGFPIPPRELWAHYCTGEQSWLASGLEDCETMAKILSDGTPLGETERVLDLGCAAGRMTRHIPALAPDAVIWGTDIWSTAILWCQDHLTPRCSFATTTMAPHLPFEDRSFDLVYCGSLFTHIDDLAEAWFAELHRILRPGGCLYFSINDQHAVRIFEGHGHPDAYPRYYERTGGKAAWDSFVAQLSENPDYRRFRDGDAYMFAMGRSLEAHVMWNTEVLTERLRWGYRQLSVNPHSYGHQTTVLLERT